MPLHMTKIAFQAESAATLRTWLESHAGEGEARLTTRYLPKRYAEMTDSSLYWVLGHQLIGRSPLLGFADRPDGKHWIRLAPMLIAAVPRPKRAHQGWRYLSQEDAPPDLGEVGQGDVLPAEMVAALSRLGLL